MVIKHPNQEAVPNDQKKWIICCLGKDERYEHRLSDLIKMSGETGANVLVFNYRGVGLSEDRSPGPFETVLNEQDLIADGEAALTHVIKEYTADPKNILLYGHSQGGAVAAQVAVNHQEPGKEVHLCIDRSYTSYKDVSTALGKSMLGRVGAVLGRFFAFTISRQWKFDSETAFSKIKTQHKFVILSEQDDVIPAAARLKGGGALSIQLAPIDQGKNKVWWRRLFSVPLSAAHNISIFDPTQSKAALGGSSPKEQFVEAVKTMFIAQDALTAG